jgi:hypothetical protein
MRILNTHFNFVDHQLREETVLKTQPITSSNPKLSRYYNYMIQF